MTDSSNLPITATGLVAEADDIPTLPDIYFRIREVLEDPASTHVDVADVLGTDPGIAARILKLANSAFYGRPGTISRIAQAVGLLGTQQVHDLVLATVVIDSTKQMIGGQSAQRTFWQLSVTIASAAKFVAEECGILDAERMFVAGLVSQLGNQLMQQLLPEQMARCQQAADQTGADLASVQRQQIGFDHAETAAALFDDWKFPRELTLPIRWQTQPALAPEHQLEAAILHVASALAAGLLKGSTLDEVLSTIDDDAWQTVEMTREQLSSAGESAQALTEDIAPILIDLAA